MPGGRPTTYTEELASEMCERIACGESVRAVCKDKGMPVLSTFFLWLSKHDEFSKQYAKAKELSIEALAEEMFDIADNGGNDWIEVNGDSDSKSAYKANGENIQRSKLRVDTRKWYLSKIAPKKYGESQRIEHDVSDKVADIAERVKRARHASSE